MANENAILDDNGRAVILGKAPSGNTKMMEVDDEGAPIVNPKALNKTNDAVTAHIAPSDSRIAITASAQILSKPGKLKGFWIVSHVPGATVRFSDALTATTPYVSSAWTSAAGHLAGQYIQISQNGMQMATGCYVTITGTIEILVDAISD